MASNRYPYVYFKIRVAALSPVTRGINDDDTFINPSHRYLDFKSQRSKFERPATPQPPVVEEVEIFGFDDWTSIEDSVFS